MLRGQNSVPTTELFRYNGDGTRGKLSLQHVPATCPLVCAGLKSVEGKYLTGLDITEL